MEDKSNTASGKTAKADKEAKAAKLGNGQYRSRPQIRDACKANKSKAGARTKGAKTDKSANRSAAPTLCTPAQTPAACAPLQPTQGSTPIVNTEATPGGYYWSQVRGQKK